MFVYSVNLVCDYQEHLEAMLIGLREYIHENNHEPLHRAIGKFKSHAYLIRPTVVGHHLQKGPD